jgi:hypothetical protein
MSTAAARNARVRPAESQTPAPKAYTSSAYNTNSGKTRPLVGAPIAKSSLTVCDAAL